MKRLIFAVAMIALAVVGLGCDTGKDKTLAPMVNEENATAYAGWQVVSTEWTEVNGVKVKIETRKQGVNLIRVLYICDFPMGYYGPPSPGHCYEDGSGCTGPPISDCRILQCAPQLGTIGVVTKGDPTADDATGDPDATGGPHRADNDGVVIH